VRHAEAATPLFRVRRLGVSVDTKLRIAFRTRFQFRYPDADGAIRSARGRDPFKRRNGGHAESANRAGGAKT